MLGWLGLVLAAFAVGQLLGTASLPQYDPGQSGRAEQTLQRLGVITPPAESVLIQARAPGARFAADPAMRQAARQVAAALDGLPRSARDIAAPPDNGRSRLISADGRSALVTFEVPGNPSNEDAAVAPALRAVAAVQARHPGLRVREAGDASMDRVANAVLSRDFRKAEVTSVPITLILLLAVFGALIAAGIPLLLAGTAVITAISLLAVPSHWLPIGSSTSEVVLIIGMAVGIDYTLFYLRREREERAAGRSTGEALRIAARTSGRAIVVSGLTVMTALAGLFLTGYSIFTGVAIGAIAVVGIAVAGSVTVLPALLSLLGGWADRGRIPFLGRRRMAARPSRLWAALARRVVRRPAAWGGVAALLMLALAVPALGLRLGNPPDSGFPASLPVVATQASIQRAFPGRPAPAQVVVTGRTPADLTSAGLRAALTELRAAASARGPVRPGVTASAVAGGRALIVDVPLAGEGGGAVSNGALLTLRDRILPATLGHARGVSWAVTGETASNYDDIAVLHSRTPLVLAVVAVLAFVLLLVAFRSVAIPLVSVGLNLLSVAAAYGLVTLIFQDGTAAGAAGLHRLRGDRAVDPAVHVRVPVRAEHGLPRVHPEPDPRAALRWREHAGRHRGRHLQQRRGGDQRRRDHGGGLLDPGHAVADPAQDAGRRPGRGGTHRRDGRARDPGAGRPGAAGRAQLVAAPLAILAARPHACGRRARG